MSTSSLSPLLSWFPSGERERVTYHEARHALITDDFDELIEQWVEEQAGEETAEQWGRPDTSLNPISSATRQLATPGLYGTRPEVHGDPTIAEALDAAGWWGRGQHASYLQIGIGIVFRRCLLRATRRGEATDVRVLDKLVAPHRVHVVCDPDDPSDVRELYHLHRRRNAAGEVAWVWDAWRLTTDPATGRVVGTWSVHVPHAEQPTGGAWSPGRDVSADYLRDADGRAGPISGDAFPCVDEAGDAVLPWAVYRATDTGEFWPLHWRRAMHRGSLHAATHWTYVERTALFATGEAHLLVGLDADALPVQVRKGDNDGDASAKPAATIALHPNTLVPVPRSPDAGPVQDVKVGPGLNLPVQLEFAIAYNALTHVADGLNPSDATRSHANPTSGMALEISARNRREFANQIEPFCLRADMRAIELYTHQFRRVYAGATFAEASTWAIKYAKIPLTPQEQDELRKQLDWEAAAGQLSRVELRRRLYPTKSEKQAKAELVAIAVQDAELDKAIKDAVALVAPPPPPPPPFGGAVPPGDEVDNNEGGDAAEGDEE